MENSYCLYQNYVQGVRCAYGISFPFLSINEWLEKSEIMRNPEEFQESKFQDPSFPRIIDGNSSVSSATSATSLPSSDNNKKLSTNR